MTETHKFVIAGAGGSGSWLAEALVRALEFGAPGSILMIIDGDNYEEKNKERQNLTGAGNKAEILAHKLAPNFPNTYIVPVAKWIVADGITIEVDPEDVEEDGSPSVGRVAASEVVTEGSVVYAVVDNFKCRRDIMDAALKLDNVDIFLAGNDDYLYGSVYHYRRRGGVDITQNPVERMPELADPPDRNPGEMSCAERAALDGGTQVLAVNMGVASYLSARTHKYIMNDYDTVDLTESDIYFDLGIGLAQPHDRRVDAKVEALV